MLLQKKSSFSLSLKAQLMFDMCGYVLVGNKNLNMRLLKGREAVYHETFGVGIIES